MRVFRVARLAARERHVIGLLRGADPTAVSSDMHTLFRRLCVAASAIGYRAAAIDCACTTRQELCLLGCLAALQRDNPDVLLRVADPIRPITLLCARRLQAEGIHLSHATISRLSGLPDACAELAISPVPTTFQQPKLVRRPLPPAPGSVQERALDLVRTYGVTSSRELAASGISRQVVSLMFKRGLLVRVGTGNYRAAAETVRG
ncbi:hypothetical protein CA262_20125 [Sphingobium sp. GW456-12-10-14-TSB1]|jgi:hypothetical protein|nr:hypothetical protein [Novosphingobium sp. EMRT-2]OUC52911.1 hypothetical protein CA262_20125 [Sphingobium sp. GW456-12-10-14-TSB1]QCI92951.1 hypothetical protein FA702_04845 [Novosphingobium sp. EMRT-2]